MSSPALPATSGVSNFNPRAIEIITAAFQIMAVIDASEVPDDTMVRQGIEVLSAMMKELEATGYHVWTEEEGILFLQQNQIRYLLGPAPDGTPSPDHCADAEDYALTTLEESAIAGNASVIVADPTGIEAGDYFGIVTNDGSAFWTRVKAAPTGPVLQLVDALTGDSNAGNFVFAYTTNIERPLRIPFCRRLQYAVGNNAQGNIITPLVPMMSRSQYFDLPEPRTPGTVTQAYYDPARDQGKLYVWNAPGNANFGLRFTWYRPLLVFTSTDDTADLPQEWGNALKWNLARELMLRYQVGAQRAQIINQTATAKLELVMGWDREDTSVYFGRNSPRTRGGR